MFNLYSVEKLAKIEHTERLKDAAERRAARIAQGETRQPTAGWRMITLSLAVVTVGLILLMALL